MNYLDSSKQHEELISKASKEASKPYDFKYEILCMVGGLKDDGKPLKIVTSMEKKGQKLNYVQKEDDTTWSHESNHRKAHT